MQQGFTRPDGERLEGLREMLEKLRQRRRERLEQYDLGGVYDDIAQELRDVVDMERSSLDELISRGARSRATTGVRRSPSRSPAEKQLQLDMLPPDLAGQVRDLQQYEFTSSEARERFEELLDQLRQQLMQGYVDQMAGAMESTWSRGRCSA